MGVGGVASGSGPGAFPSEIMKKIRSQANRGRRRNFEKCLRHRRAGPSHPVRSACEHSNPQRTKASAARAVAETQNDGASQEGTTPKPGAVRGTQWAALRSWRSGWDGEFESPLLQRRVTCELGGTVLFGAAVVVSNLAGIWCATARKYRRLSQLRLGFLFAIACCLINAHRLEIYGPLLNENTTTRLGSGPTP
jgi:hypothetical protein